MSDPHAAEELKLYIDNDGNLYRSQPLAILKNLATKRARGEYRHDLAVKLFGHRVESGAKKYNKEFGSGQPWHQLAEAERRGISLDFHGRHDHARKKSPAQLKHEIAAALGTRRYF